jgi:hypothetical protein
MYNVCRMASTAEAIGVVTECLKGVYVGDVGRVQRFRDEQVRGAAIPDGDLSAPDQSEDTTLSAIRIDGTPYSEAADAIKGEGYRDLMGRANLLLLAGRPADARRAFEQAYATADDKRAEEAAEGLARTMRAEDGSVGRANAWVISLRSR